MDAHVILSALWWCVKPSTVATASLVLGVGLLVFGRRRMGFAALAVCAFVLANAFVLPTTQVLTTALERRVEPVAELPAVVDGIIVLGGNSAVRLPAFAELAMRYPEARLVFSGGGGEAESARRYLSGFDGLVERTVFEDRSRNTMENAVFSLELVRPAADEVWVLVTSAMHMARAAETFEHIAWYVLAHPVGTALPGSDPDVNHGLMLLDGALRELSATITTHVVGRAPGLR